ncbi:MAG: sigma-70 family RNA polymerase sigma factor [Bacteroidales bacterium]|nr:MAG: sigma-70 family RNA polymerase sigma factor [Bacteroidales bacterium]
MRKYKELSDEELFNKLKSGDEYAFDVLFYRYYPQLCAIAKTHLKNKDLAEDIVQELFIEIYEKRATIGILVSIKSYLYKSVFYKCMASLKRNRDNIPIDLMGDSFESNLNENSIEYFELQIKLNAAIESLPPQCRKIFMMNRFESLKYKEIAHQFQFSSLQFFWTALSACGCQMQSMVISNTMSFN